RLVLHHDRGADRLAQAVAEHARHDVGRAARRVGDEDLDRPRRVLVLRLGRAEAERQAGGGEQDRQQRFHWALPDTARGLGMPVGIAAMVADFAVASLPMFVAGIPTRARDVRRGFAQVRRSTPRNAQVETGLASGFPFSTTYVMIRRLLAGTA